MTMNIKLPANYIELAAATPGVADWKGRIIAHTLDGLTGEKLVAQINKLATGTDAQRKVIRYLMSAGDGPDPIQSPANKKANPTHIN